MWIGLSELRCARNSLFTYSSPNKRISDGSFLRWARRMRRYSGMGGSRASGSVFRLALEPMVTGAARRRERARILFKKNFFISAGLWMLMTWGEVEKEEEAKAPGRSDMPRPVCYGPIRRGPARRPQDSSFLTYQTAAWKLEERVDYLTQKNKLFGFRGSWQDTKLTK